MDTTICGLNKVVCRTALSNNGSIVTITNGTNTWSSEVVGGIASFLIPSVPAPAKTTYTVTLDTYSRDIEIGFGDSIDITLDEAHETAIQADITNLQNQIDTINSTRLTTSEVTAVRALLAKLNNKNLVSASKSGSTLYLTSIR